MFVYFIFFVLSILTYAFLGRVFPFLCYPENAANFPAFSRFPVFQNSNRVCPALNQFSRLFPVLCIKSSLVDFFARCLVDRRPMCPEWCRLKSTISRIEPTMKRCDGNLGNMEISEMSTFQRIDAQEV